MDWLRPCRRKAEARSWAWLACSTCVLMLSACVDHSSVDESGVFPSHPRSVLPSGDSAGSSAAVLCRALWFGCLSTKVQVLKVHRSCSGRFLDWLDADEERFATDSPDSSVVSWLKDRDSPHPYQGESRYSTIQKKLTGLSLPAALPIQSTKCPLIRVALQISTLLRSETLPPHPLFHSAIQCTPLGGECQLPLR